MAETPAASANGADGAPPVAATKSERIARAIARGIKRRRGMIDGDPSLRQIVITIRLHPSSGNFRGGVLFALEGEEFIEHSEAAS